MDRLISLTQNRSAPAARRKIALLRAPFFSPMSPPLGIATLKAYLEKHGHHVRCVDFNVDPDLWNTQRMYFEALKAQDELGIRDGLSRLWGIINVHMHAFLSGRGVAACERVIDQAAPLLGLRLRQGAFAQLHHFVERFYHRLGELLTQIDLAGYDFVGASTYSTSLAPSLYSLRTLKQRFPKIRTIMGGGVFADDLALGSSNLETLTRDFPEVDHIILGEGELLALRLVQGALTDRRVITIADAAPDRLDIGDVPAPSFDDFDLESYFHLSIEGGRSCPFECSFCS